MSWCLECCLRLTEPRRSARTLTARARNSGRPDRPKNGFFSEVDVNAPLYKPRGGRGSEDPTKRSTNRWVSDFIWNTDSIEQVEAKAEQVQQDTDRKAAAIAASSSEGFLSFNRVSVLEDINVDISAQLKAKRKPLVTKQPDLAPMRRNDGSKKNYSDPPTSGEFRRWERSGSFVRRAAVSSAALDATNTPGSRRAAEDAQYEEEKRKSNYWATGTAAICFVLVYANYSQEVAGSYLLGALGGLAYLRLLNKSVDSFGASSIAAAAGGAISQPRLLIPAILVLLYNRYNTLFADEAGMHLQLLPMLLGFFTYKAGVLGRGAVSLFEEFSAKKA